MKIGTASGALLKRFGDEQAIIKLAEAGFDCIDFGLFDYSIHSDDSIFKQSDDEFKVYFTHLGDVAKTAGIEIGQLHSPMPSYTAKPDEDAFLFKIQEKSIKAAAYMNSKYIIIHPCIPGQYRYTHYREECKEINMEFYRALLPTLIEYDVKLAVENMFNYDPVRKCICPTVCTTADEMADYIDTLNDDHFVACLDVGHAHLTGDTPENMARILGNRLETLHVHDNNGLNDEHKIPYHGTINWDNFLKVLPEIGYKGSFSFEAGDFYTMYGGMMPEECARFLCKLGNEMVNNRR
jgi:Sugar phosphate isomerases/epimerases